MLVTAVDGMKAIIRNGVGSKKEDAMGISCDGSRKEESSKMNSINMASFKLGISKSLLIHYFPLPKEFKILYVQAKNAINI